MEIRKQLSLDERRAKATAWALTFADMVTLLLTFFVLLLVILNDAEKHIDRVINRLLDETYDSDHVKPLFKGGSNEEFNLQALCKRCHAMKSALEQSIR